MKTKPIFKLACVITIAWACAPAYIPNVVNTPLLTEKNDLNLAVYTSTAGFDAQGSFAVTDHIGIMANGSWADRTSDSSDNFHKHAFFEGGVGYYSRFGNSGVADVYAGYGQGWVESNYDDGFFYDYANANISRIFIQPSVGATTDIFDGSFSSRLVMATISQGNKSETGYFIEPVLTGKLGYKYVKFVAQMGMSIPFNNNQFEFDYEPFMISLGIQVNLGAIFFKSINNSQDQ